MMEDELDYEGDDFAERGGPMAMGSPHDSAGPGDGEADPDAAEGDGAGVEGTNVGAGFDEDEYEDLYQDVNVGFYQSPATGKLGGEGGRGRIDGEGQVVDDTEYWAQAQGKNVAVSGMVDPAQRVPRGLQTAAAAENALLDRGRGRGWASGGEERQGENPGVRVPGLAARDMGRGRMMMGQAKDETKDQTAEYEALPIDKSRSRIVGQSKQDMKEDMGYDEEEEIQSGREVEAGASANKFKDVADSAARSYPSPMINKGDEGMVARASRALTVLSSSNAGSDGTLPRSNQMVPGRESPSATGSSQQGGVQPTDGRTQLFVGELHWWTTDAELEAALSEYGRVKSLKFFEERASGKSKGYSQVEFCDPRSAHMCKERMNGRVFNGRPCVVTFASSQSLKQLSANQYNKQQQAPSSANQGQVQGKRAGGRGGPGQQGGDGSGRGAYGAKMGMGQGAAMGGGRGPGRGRGMGGRNMGGNGHYGQGPHGPLGNPGGMMTPQAMMGQGYDPTFAAPMGRMGYGMGPAGGFVPRATYPSMAPPYPAVAPALPGVAPHVNPAFFGRGANGHSMGMMSGGSSDVAHRAWGDGSMSGWGAEENERWTRDSGGYEEDSAEYGYSPEVETEAPKGRSSREQEGDWQGRRRRDEKDPERHREKEREAYKEHRERGWEREKERERPSRGREKARYAEDDESFQSREEEYSKKRRFTGDRKAE